MTIHHQEPETVPAPPLGEQGEPCTRCGSPLAHDQRYCLNCGLRRANARLPFVEVMEQRLRRQGDVAVPSQPRLQPSPLVAAGGVAALALAIGLGVLIGSAGNDAPRQVAAAPPQVITVAAGGTAPAAVEQFNGDWPEGKDGYTVQLQTLPKDGTQVAAVTSAKSDAQSKGAADVGALDSAEYSSLDGGNYVIYAGVFETRKQAKKTLRKLKRDFSGARIVQVSAGGGLAKGGDAGALSGKKKEATVGKNQLKQLQGLSPEEYQKKAKKLPDTTKLPGKAPPKDNKEPGGGSKGDVIG